MSRYGKENQVECIRKGYSLQIVAGHLSAQLQSLIT